MKIALDVDGPLARLQDEWLRRYNRDYNDSVTNDHIVGWDLHRFVKPECGERIYDYLRQPDLYADVPVYEGAREGVAWLRLLHDVSFVTACGKNMVDQKSDWLVRHGFTTVPRDQALPDDLIVITHKHMINADLLIDDGLHNIEPWVSSGRRAVLLDCPWNRRELNVKRGNESLCSRAKDWKEIIALVDTAGHTW